LKGKQVGILSRGDTFEISTKLALLRAGRPLDWVGYTALGSFSSLGPAFIARSLRAIGRHSHRTQGGEEALNEDYR
jgi:hypothetical protein